MERNISGLPQRIASSLQASAGSSAVVSSSERLVVVGFCKPLKETNNGSGHDDDQQMPSAAMMVVPSFRSALVGSSCDSADLEKEELVSLPEVAPPAASSKTTTITASSVVLACEDQDSSSSGGSVVTPSTPTSICPESSSFQEGLPVVASSPISNQEGGRTTDARSNTAKVAQLVSPELSSPWWCRHSKRDANKHEVTDGPLAHTLSSAPSISLTEQQKADLELLDGPFLHALEQQADTTVKDEEDDHDDHEWGQLHHSVQKRGQAVMPNNHRHSQRPSGSSGENKQNHHNQPARHHTEVRVLPQTTRCASSFPAYRGGAVAPPQRREIAEIERTGLGSLFPIIPAHPLRESSTETSNACEGSDIESPEENVDEEERSRHDLVFSSEVVQSGSSDQDLLSLLTKKERILSILDSALQVIESTDAEYLFDVPSFLGSCSPAELMFSRAALLSQSQMPKKNP